MRIRNGKSEFMRVDGSFFSLLDKKVIRNGDARKYYKKANPNAKVYSSFKDATRDLARELNGKW